MKNVTISMDEELAQRGRVAAAKHGLSMSRFMSGLLEKSLAAPAVRAPNPDNPQYRALQRILAGPKWDVTENGRMPTSDERNARR
jgi:plasmid stability protein